MVNCPECDSSDCSLISSSGAHKRYELVEGFECQKCGNEFTRTHGGEDLIDRLLDILKE